MDSEFYVCKVLSSDKCVEWIEYSSPYILPEGAGWQIGAALFMGALTAFLIRFIVSIIYRSY